MSCCCWSFVKTGALARRDEKPPAAANRPPPPLPPVSPAREEREDEEDDVDEEEDDDDEALLVLRSMIPLSWPLSWCSSATAVPTGGGLGRHRRRMTLPAGKSV